MASDMDFRLKVFATVAKNLNYSLSAKELGISQPAVTKHIQALEEHYKIQLFSRNGNKLNITYGGELLLEKVRRIIALYSDLEENSSLISKIPQGEFLLEVPPPVYYGFLPAFVGEFCRLAPDSTLEVVLNREENGTEREEDRNTILQKETSVNKIKISYSSEPFKNRPTLFTDNLIVVGGAAFNPETYYELQELKFLTYTSDSQTTKDIIQFFESSDNDYSKLNVIANVLDSQAIIRLLLSYQKYSKKAPLAVAFLWQSQVAKFLKDRKMQAIQIHGFQDFKLPKRYYAIEAPQNKESESFVRFLSSWISGLI